MILAEIFDKKHPYEIVKATANLMSAKATINGRNIDLRISEDEPGVWEFAFYEKDSTKLTGSGGAIQVFSVVSQFLKSFIEQYQPEQIFFSASSGRQNGFYSKALNRLKITGYKTSENKTGHFWITKI